MARAERVSSKAEDLIGYMIYCPACRHGHLFYTEKAPKGKRPVWDFNGNVEKPTFKPSLLVYTPKHSDGTPQKTICHSYVTDGKIRYLNDCAHDMKGKTVDLPDEKDWYPDEDFTGDDGGDGET